MVCNTITVTPPAPTVTVNDYGFADCFLPLCAGWNKICTSVPYADVKDQKLAFWVNYTVANWNANVKITVTFKDKAGTTYTITYTWYSIVPGTYEVSLEHSTMIYTAGETYTITSVTATVV